MTIDRGDSRDIHVASRRDTPALASAESDSIPGDVIAIAGAGCEGQCVCRHGAGSVEHSHEVWSTRIEQIGAQRPLTARDPDRVPTRRISISIDIDGDDDRLCLCRVDKQPQSGREQKVMAEPSDLPSQE